MTQTHESVNNKTHNTPKALPFLKGLIAAVAGTAAFVALTKAEIPMPFIQNTSLQVRACLLVLVAVYFDPVSAFITGFAGHALGDALFYGGVWWSWVIPDGFAGLAMGIMAVMCRFKHLTRSINAAAMLYIIQTVTNMAAWFLLAPLLDVAIYGEEATNVFYQGLTAMACNAIISAIVCTPIAALHAYCIKARGASAVPLWDGE